jgi:hypothetical protein
MTVSLPRSARPTRENQAELQEKWRAFKQKLDRAGYELSGYGWVEEHGELADDCVCLQSAEALERGFPTHKGMCAAAMETSFIVISCSH